MLSNCETISSSVDSLIHSLSMAITASSYYYNNSIHNHDNHNRNHNTTTTRTTATKTKTIIRITRRTLKHSGPKTIKQTRSGSIQQLAMNTSRISSVSNTQYFVVRTKLLTLTSFNRFNHCFEAVTWTSVGHQNQINLSMYTAMKLLCNLCDLRAGHFLTQ